MRPLSKTNLKKDWPGRQRGAVAVLLTVAMLALLAMAGLALDGGHLLLNKTRLQNAVDAAALSGAKTLGRIKGEVGAGDLARTAALNTLTLNANAPGNEELAKAIGSSVGTFAKVEFSSSIYGAFGETLPTDPRYVRVTVANYGLPGFFWGLLQSIGGTSNKLGAKNVAAVAVAGPSPTQPCSLDPLMVCGNSDPAQYDPKSGLFWGYRFGQLEVLKSAAGNSSVIGPGNFQVIRLDGSTGASDFREALAGGIQKCGVVGGTIPTEPGNMVGPTIQGLNTRFGEASGPIEAGKYPPDWVVKEAGAKPLTLNDKVSPSRVEYDGSPVSVDSGKADITYVDNAGTTQGLYDYNDWFKDMMPCEKGATGGLCQSNGAYERRILKIVVGKCSGTDGGQTSVPVLGFACFFVLQKVDNGGKDSQIFGQFVRECEADGYPSQTPAKDSGPEIIQLYKSYINDKNSPSNDS